MIAFQKTVNKSVGQQQSDDFIKCITCNYKTKDPRNLDRHYQVNSFRCSGSKEYVAFCPVRKCKYFADTFNMVRAHLHTDHKNSIKIKTILVDRPECIEESREQIPIHKESSTEEIKSYSVPINDYPKNTSSDKVRPYDFNCHIEGCHYGCFRKAYLVKHLETKHNTRDVLLSTTLSDSTAIGEPGKCPHSFSHIFISLIVTFNLNK